MAGLKYEEDGLSGSKPVKYFMRRFENDKIIRLHYHNSLEINVCRNVDGLIRLGEGSLSLSPDCFILLPPEIPHSYKFNRCNGTVEVYHFLIDAMPGIAEALRNSLRTMVIPLSVLNPSVEDYLSVLQNGGIESVIKLSGILLLLVGELNTQKSRKRSDPVSVPSPFLRKVIDFAENNYHQLIDLKAVSLYAGMSKYHFCRVFKEKTGETWTDYLRSVRLAKSQDFLKKGLSVSETASCCGFESDSYFIKCFKKEYHLTPMQWFRDK